MSYSSAALSLPNGRGSALQNSFGIDLLLGTIRLSHVTDTRGLPFLDSGDSVINFHDESGLDVKLYQSKRAFQEQSPWVDDVNVEGDDLKWSDGLYRYTLQIKAIAPTTQAATRPSG
jgi:hypothetical protein